MHYSVATVGLSIGGAIFVLPHLPIGGASLAAGIIGKPFFKGLSGVASRIVHIAFGMVFVGVSSYAILSGIYNTQLCRMALNVGSYVTIRGPIEVIQRFQKPGYGYAEFKIDGHKFRTIERGVECDCGFITPLGKLIHLERGMQVEAKVANGLIVELDVQPSRAPSTTSRSDSKNEGR